MPRPCRSSEMQSTFPSKSQRFTLKMPELAELSFLLALDVSSLLAHQLPGGQVSVCMGLADGRGCDLALKRGSHFQRLQQNQTLFGSVLWRMFGKNRQQRGTALFPLGCVCPHQLFSKEEASASKAATSLGDGHGIVRPLRTSFLLTWVSSINCLACVFA